MTLKVRDLRIDPASLGAKKLLVDIAPAYQYDNGKRTDNVTGYRYIIALPAHSLEKIGVRIDGKQFMAVKFRHRLRKQQRPQRVRWQAQQAQPVRQAQQARE